MRILIIFIFYFWLFGFNGSFFNYVVSAQTNKSYVLKGQFVNYSDQNIILAYHNGIGLVVYDSLRINHNGFMEQILTPTVPGIYTLVFPKNNLARELVLDQDSVVEFKLDSSDQFQAKPKTENGIFYAMKFTVDSLNKLISNEFKWLQNANNSKQKLTNKEITKHKNNLQYYDKLMEKKVYQFKKRYPKHILSLIYSLRKSSDLDIHKLNTSQDSINYRFNVKRNFFNDSIFSDPRMLRISVWYDYLNTYFGKIVEQNIDTLSIYSDILAKQLVNKNYALFQDFAKYIFTKYVRFTPFVGSDILYYNLYRRYIRDDERSMANIEGWRLRQYGTLLEDNQIFMDAPNFRLLKYPNNDTTLLENITTKNLYLLCFWDPQCYHCRKAMPKVDSMMFKANMAEHYGLKVISITLGEEHGLQDFIEKEHLSPEWLHLFDNSSLRELNFSQNIKDVRRSYGLFQTPTFYLLDKNKQILAKNFSYIKIPDILKLVRGF